MHKAAIAELTHGGNIPWLSDHLVPTDDWDKGAYNQHFNSRVLKDSVSQVSLWIYLLVTERFTAHRVEAPIVSRMYQELSNGMLGFHNAVKIKTTPFPFPFAQIISISMFVLTVTLPIVINQYVDDFLWCIVFTILTCFGYFMLAEVACEMEQPFGDDDNDLPLTGYQVEFDKELLCMCEIMSYETPSVNVDLIRNELPLYNKLLLENHGVRNVNYDNVTDGSDSSSPSGSQSSAELEEINESSKEEEEDFDEKKLKASPLTIPAMPAQPDAAAGSRDTSPTPHGLRTGVVHNPNDPHQVVARTSVDNGTNPMGLSARNGGNVHHAALGTGGHGAHSPTQLPIQPAAAKSRVVPPVASRAYVVPGHAVAMLDESLIE